MPTSRDGLELTEIVEVPTLSQVSLDVDSGGNDDHNGNNRKLQQANIARIVKAKDLGSLREFGGVRGFAEALDTDLENGIPAHEDGLCCRHITCALPETQDPKQHFFHFVLNACNKYIIFLLLLCAVLSLVFGIKEEGLDTGWYEGAFIFNAVIVLVAVPSIHNFWYSQLSGKQKLSKRMELVVNVFRGGCQQEISISDVVLGDIVCLKVGQQVPADGLFINGESLKVDNESSVDDQNPFIFYGAKVINGNGRMLVTSVGMETVWGEMMSMVTNAPNKKTPLRVQLDKLNTCTQVIGLLITILILIILFLRFNLAKEHDGSDFPDLKGKPAAIRDFLDAIEKIVMKPRGKISILTTSLTLLLVGMAEGLPFVISTICTDKPCGLTSNQMEIDMFYIGEEFIIEDSIIAPDVSEALCSGISTPVLKLNSPSNSTEDPLSSWASLKWGMEMEDLKQQITIVEAKELNSKKEGCAVLIRKNGDNGESMSLHCKGLATTILAMCSHYYESSGTVKAIDKQKRKAFEQVIARMKFKHLKPIAYAYKKVDVQMLEEKDLILIGLLGLKHSCRKAIEACVNAGINFKLVSGDNVSELEAIALECGILMPNSDAVVHGEKFRNSTEKERMDMVERICIIGNCLPMDRLLLLKCLKKKGHIVAVVGFRTDETLTLKEADVGITIGSRSTEMARESSDIIVSSENFNFLVTIMMCGRCAYENIQKFIQLQLPGTIAWLLINPITTVHFGDAPITAIQVFWVFFTVAILGGLALLTEPPSNKLMEKPPVSRTDPLITRIMWRNIVPQASYQAAILVTFQFKGQPIVGINQKVSKTMIFNSFFLCQVFNQFTARELEKKNVFKGIHQNHWFWLAVGTMVVCQGLFIEIAHILGHSARLNGKHWACLFSSRDAFMGDGLAWEVHNRSHQRLVCETT
ncbi:hypothetical protein F0562_013443 [Nyssa sinensis]|uniref:Uncharacterized protein n=1 Tax=Nyssa sinensis TaxID=561372 RepID=A0A5J4ZNC5_9ASTE|nr:hypothetical protein F0562_013443 [Nyssa sinensis]